MESPCENLYNENEQIVHSPMNPTAINCKLPDTIIKMNFMEHKHRKVKQFQIFSIVNDKLKSE